ncbi:hypothetical protein ACOSQ2_031575 [Xanthoceras sorbifolium]
MNSDKIAELCAALHLSDEEGPVHSVGGNVKIEGSKKLALSLVGKLLAGRQTNREAFRIMIPKIWRLTNEVSVELVRDNIFAFHFQNALDKNRVLAGGPWNFDNSLLILEEPRGWGDISKMSFSKADFWIQIHNVPLLCMTRNIGLQLGAKIGKVKDMDVGASGDCTGKFLRVRVEVDVCQPLKRGLRIRLEDSEEEQTLLLRYERMPEFCFECGLIGHSFRECPSKNHQKDATDFTKHKYGTWIRASSPTKERFSHHGKNSNNMRNSIPGGKERQEKQDSLKDNGGIATTNDEKAAQLPLVPPKGKEKMTVDSQQVSAGCHGGKSPDLHPGFQAVSAGEKSGTKSMPDPSKSKNVSAENRGCNLPAVVGKESIDLNTKVAETGAIEEAKSMAMDIESTGLNNFLVEPGPNNYVKPCLGGVGQLGETKSCLGGVGQLGETKSCLNNYVKPCLGGVGQLSETKSCLGGVGQLGETKSCLGGVGQLIDTSKQSLAHATPCIVVSQDRVKTPTWKRQARSKGLLCTSSEAELACSKRQYVESKLVADSLDRKKQRVSPSTTSQESISLAGPDGQVCQAL